MLTFNRANNFNYNSRQQLNSTNFYAFKLHFIMCAADYDDANIMQARQFPTRAKHAISIYYSNLKNVSLSMTGNRRVEPFPTNQTQCFQLLCGGGGTQVVKVRKRTMNRRRCQGNRNRLHLSDCLRKIPTRDRKLQISKK